ncbi:MAG: FtsX-like permease family protein [Pseudomonadota bacterium]
MIRQLYSAAAALAGEGASDKVVPGTGPAAWLTVFVAAVMGFLAVFSMALAVSTDRLAERWSADLGRVATVQVTGTPDTLDALTDATMRILEETPGVAFARMLSDEEQAALLEPWLGPDLPFDTLPVPRLIEVVPGNPPYDVEGLGLRLAGELPGVRLDDHGRWRAPLVAAATRIRTLGYVALGLIAAATAALVVLATRSTLATNAPVIEVLRLLGARDAFIARAFVRRLTLRTGLGAVVGASLAASALALVPAPPDQSGLLVDLGFQGWQWIWPIAVPFGAAFIAFWATRQSTLSRLRGSM